MFLENARSQFEEPQQVCEITDEIIKFMKNIVITTYRDCQGTSQTVRFMVPQFGCVQMLMDDILFIALKAFNIARSRWRDGYHGEGKSTL